MASKTINPTRMELTRLKGRLKTATRGHKLLKDKRDELMKQFLEIVRRNRELRRKVEEGLEKANAAFTVASALMSPEMLEQALLYPKQSVELDMKYQNIMSVNVPVYEFHTKNEDPAEIYPYGFAQTSGELDAALEALANVFSDMLELAEALTDYTIFYNGPKCGASAPDHMHFQAGNSDFLTIAPAIENAELKTIAADGDATLSLVDTLPVKVFVIDAADHSAGERLFGRLLEAMPVPEGEREPMLNLLCYSTPAGERLVVIPRKRHRPACYGTDNGCMLISPASVDVGGVFITPRPEDFERMDQAAIASILDEVCLTAEEIGEIASHVR